MVVDEVGENAKRRGRRRSLEALNRPGRLAGGLRRALLWVARPDELGV